MIRDLSFLGIEPPAVCDQIGEGCLQPGDPMNIRSTALIPVRKDIRLAIRIRLTACPPVYQRFRVQFTAEQQDTDTGGRE